MRENRCPRALRLDTAVARAEMWLVKQIQRVDAFKEKHHSVFEEMGVETLELGEGSVHLGHSERSPMSCKACSTCGVTGCLNGHLGPGKVASGPQ